MIDIRALVLAGLVLAAVPPMPLGATEPHEIYQTSVVSTLWQGDYQGHVSIGDLRRHGDLGLGALDSLDGELVGLDGNFFRIRADGSVQKLNDTVTVPFAVVTPFHPVSRLTLAAVDSVAALGQTIDQHLVRVDTVVSVRIHATFPYLKLRSVPRQERPYPPLAEVIKTQPIFEYENVTGTLVGFRAPDTMKGVNAVGYHLHFISDDLTKGGHLLDLKTPVAVAEVDYAETVVVQMPAGPARQVTEKPSENSDAATVR